MFQPVSLQFLRRTSSLKLRSGQRQERGQRKLEQDNDEGEEEEETAECSKHSITKVVAMDNGEVHGADNIHIPKPDRPPTSNNIVLDPDGDGAYYWMGVVTLAVIYNLAVTILRLTFVEMRELWLPFNMFYILDLVCDGIYVLDILTQFRIAYYDDGCLETDPAKLAVNYRQQNRFTLDVVSVLPLYTVSSTLLGCMNFVVQDTLVLTGSLYITLTRIPRLLKIHNMARFFDITDSRTSNPNKVRAFKLSLYLWLVIHWIGCVYYIISEYEGRGSNEWVYPSGEDFDPFTRKYVRSLYWSMLILTTIGERPSPDTDLEYVFTGTTFVIGVFVFAAVVGNVGDVISNMNASRQEFQARMDQIKFYMNHQKVPESLQNRVKRWAEYSWSRSQATEVSHLLQMLPHRLRSEIAIQVHLDTLKQVKIFEECEEGLLRELVLKLKPQTFSPGDYICHIGEIGREMYIINHGKVEILVPNAETGQRTVVKRLVTGHYFGEISLLKLHEGHNRRTADVRAVGYSELLCLSRKDLMTALVEYPEAKQILEKIARERITETKNVTHTKESGGTSPNGTSSAGKTKKKKDWFFDVIKSEGFQKLMSNKGTEMSELQKVINELKRVKAEFVNTVSATEKLRSMERKLMNSEIELQKAQYRITELEQSLKTTPKTSVPSHRCGQNEKTKLKQNDKQLKHGNSKGPDAPCVRSETSKRSQFPTRFRSGERFLKSNKKYSSEGCLHSESSQTNKTPTKGLSHSVQRLSRNTKDSKLIRDSKTSRKDQPINGYAKSRNDAFKLQKTSDSIRRSASATRNSESTEFARNSSGYSSDTETMATLLRASALLGIHADERESHIGDNSAFDTDDNSTIESDYGGGSDSDENRWDHVTNAMLKWSSAIIGSSSQYGDNSVRKEQNKQFIRNALVKETVV